MLTAERRAELQALRGDASLTPADRDRVEMLALSEAGWTVPAIAVHLGYHPETVRRLFRRVRSVGLAELRHQRPGPAPDLARRERLEATLRSLLEQERSWTAAQVAAALREHGFPLSTRQTRRYLQPLAAWRRTQRSLAHKQDPVRVAQAKEDLAFFRPGRRRAS
jgi:transposase